MLVSTKSGRVLPVTLFCGTPFLENQNVFHGFCLKKMQAFTGYTVLWQALSGKPKSLPRVLVEKKCKLLPVTLFCGRPFLENQNVFHGFCLKKRVASFFLSHCSVAGPFWKTKCVPRFSFEIKRFQATSGHTVLWQALSGKQKCVPRFSFEKTKVPSYKRSHRSAGTPLQQTRMVFSRFWFKKSSNL